MSLGSVKASTQDNANGTPVASGVNENGTGTIQATVQVGNKTTWTETSRTALTAADAPTGGDLTATGFGGSGLIDCENALNVRVRATCGTASATLSGRVVFYDGSGNAQGYSELLTFNSDGTLRLGNATGDFVSQRQLVDVGTARKCKFLVTAVSAGTWAVYVQPC